MPTKREVEQIQLNAPLPEILTRIGVRRTAGLSDANVLALDTFAADLNAGVDDVYGDVSGIVYTSSNTDYSSSIDSITNLKLKYAYDNALNNLPIVVIMHGYSQEIADFDSAVFTRMAGYKFFVLAVGMRGRDSASGTKDSSGREIQDIVDAVEYVKANFVGRVNPNKVCLVGYSGGGGNAFACAAKFPDYFSVIVSHFGMSDYGQDATYGWHQQMTAASNSAQVTNIETQIGGSPATYPDRYIARNHTLAAARNYKKGFLYLFHDADDVSVPSNHSSRVAANFVSESNPNYRLSITTSSDSPRWLHNLPNTGEAVINTETVWKDKILTRRAWVIPPTGTIRVCGYIKTKRFSIWLGTGIDEAADVTYDTVAGTYQVTTLTGSVSVVIVQGNKGKTETVTTTSTLTVLTLGFTPNDLLPNYYLGPDQAFTGSGASWVSASTQSLVFNSSEWDLYVKLAPTDGQAAATQVYFGYFISSTPDTVSFRIDTTGKLSARLGAVTSFSNPNTITTANVIFANGANASKLINWRSTAGVIKCFVDGVEQMLTSTAPNGFGPYSSYSMYYGATNNAGTAAFHYAGGAKGMFLKQGILNSTQRTDLELYLNAL